MSNVPAVGSEPNVHLERLVSTLGVHHPTDEQAAVITHPLSTQSEEGSVAAPLLVVAGAGSGKTETMSLRAVYLVATAGITDDSILGLTFTRKAAAELEDRLTDRLAQLAQSQGQAHNQRGFLDFSSAAVATTYNAFALRVVQEFGSLIGISGEVSHLDEAAKWQLMHGVVEAWTEPLEGDSSVGSVVDSALELREAITNQGMSAAEAGRGLDRLDKQFADNAEERKGKLPAFLKGGQTANRMRRQLLDVIEEFERQKQAMGRMDYADQVIAATRIVEEVPSVRAELRQRHQVVFLDEFQDTSVAQMHFLAALFGDHPVTAVGDPNQAIYGWRGASAGSLDDFHRLFTTNPDSPRTTLTLSIAWRNASKILDIANAVAEPLSRRSWVSQQDDQSSGPSLTLKPQPNAGDGDVRSVYRTTAADQVEEVVRFVEETYAAETAAGNENPTIAVLCRRRMLIIPTIEALHDAGFAAETNGSDGLLFHPAVMDLRAALEVAADIGKSSHLLRLLTNLDLGAADLWQLGKWASTIARQNSEEHHPLTLLLEAVDEARTDSPDSELSRTALDRLAILGSRLRRIRRASDRSLIEQVEFARRVLHLDEEALSTGQAQDVTEVLDSFAGAASDYQGATAYPTMAGFLDWLTAAENKERGLALPSVQANPHAVQVMTIHASKGLEWDAVCVIDLEMGAFPSYKGKAVVLGEDDQGALTASSPPIPPGQGGWWTRSGELPYPLRRDRAHLPDPYIWDSSLKAGEIQGIFREDVGAYLLAEERRLAYVAFTRPRRRLMLIGSWLTGGKTPRYPSVFMEEAEQVPGVTTRRESCPTVEEILLLNEAQTQAPFPKRQGALRKRVAASAAMVVQELQGFHASETPRPTVDEVLAALTDQQLATRARVLISEHQELKERRMASASDRAQADAQRAGSEKLWEFSATELVKLARATDLWVDLRRPLPSEPQTASSLGTAFHQWVEGELRKVSAASTEKDASFAAVEPQPEDPESGLDAEGPVPLDDREQRHLAALQSQMRTIPWLTKHEVVAIEVPFAVELAGLLVRGRIDAVFRDRTSGEYLLVDWKTSRFPRWGGADERIGEYLSQLGIYEEAWRRRIGRDTSALRTQLVFVHEDGVREVGADELNQAYAQSFGQEWSLVEGVEGLRERLTPQASQVPQQD